MQIVKYWKAVAALLILMGLLGGGCRRTSGSGCPFKGGTVRVGIIISETGRRAPLIQEYQRGYEMARDEVNAAGGVLGCQVELVYEDDGSEPRGAQMAVKRLAGEDVLLIMGTTSSAATLPAVGVANFYEIPFLVPTSTSDLITEMGYEWVFRICSPSSAYAGTALDFARESLGNGATLAIVYDESLFGESGAVAAAANAAGRGLELVAYESYESGGQDYTSLLARVKEANPDVLYFVSYLDEAILLMQECRQLDLNPSLYLGSAGGFVSGDFLQAGPDAEYTIAVGQWAADANWQDANGRSAAEFAQAFSERYQGDEPALRTVLTYTALQVAADSIRRVGEDESLDWANLADVRLAVRDALGETDLQNTIFGPIKFDETRQNTHPVLLLQVIGGKFVTVYPEGYRSRAPVVPVPTWGER
ncbi:MAG: hypothetical protein B6I35_14730 [Anaerolineaceae bacterium 4572_32.2]|nr:MAG: hypothetical protein B6I35_14730 [Anaerolineaceae bacterium 4572_32.2]